MRRIALVVLLCTLGLSISLAAAAAKPPDGIKKLVELQAATLYACAPPGGIDEAGAWYLMLGATGKKFAEMNVGLECVKKKPAKLSGLQVTMAADGKSAWLYFAVTATAHDPEYDDTFTRKFRITELVAEVDGSWRVVAGAITVGAKDSEVLADVYMGDYYVPPFATGDVDQLPAELVPVAAALRDNQLASLVSDRKDFLVVGTGKDELGKSGKNFAKALNKWVRVDSRGPIVGGLSPSGTTAWLAASIFAIKTIDENELEFPFDLFLVLEKTDAGWSVVQAHLTYNG